MSKVHEDNAGYVGVSYEETQDPYFSYNKLSLPLSESQLSAKQPAEETFTVTVANSKFVVDGVSQASLSLAEGGIYKFDQSDSSNTGHPLRFSYTEDGTHGDGQEYTLGVTTNGTPGTAGAYTKIVVPFGLHDLYYYCNVHPSYGGFANVAKDSFKFTTGLPILKTTDAFGKTLGTGNNEDPYAANLVLAIPMNGANGGTTFTDVSNVIRGTGSAKTITVNNQAQTSTAESFYYGSSGAFDGSGDRLVIGNASDLVFDGDFTMESWLYIDGTGSLVYPNGDRQIAGVWTGVNSDWQFNYASSGSHNLLQFLIYDGGVQTVNSAINMNSYHSQWVHVAVQRKSGSIQMYLNGAAVGSPLSYSGTFGQTSNVAVGGRVGADARTVDGYLADFRIYKGVAKYTTPFPAGSYGMDAITYDGNGTTKTISGLNFQPDFVWIKERTDTGTGGVAHYLGDTVRGINYALASNNTNAEDDNHVYGYISDVTSDGFTVTAGANDNFYTNGNQESYVAWCWKAGGAPTTDNSAGAGNVPTAGSVKIDGANATTALAGSIPAKRLTVNTDYGFSVVKYQGSGSNGTVAHGLPSPAKWVIVKNLTTNVTGWAVYHDAIGTSTNNYIELQQAGVAGPDNTAFQSTAPTGSVFSIGTKPTVNTLNDNYVAYCWSEISGFSKFGSYTGAANLKITTGFRPRFVLIKCISEDGFNWVIVDGARGNSSNGVSKKLYPNKGESEDNDSRGTETKINFLDDGFQFADQGAETNSGTRTYIYAAFAESAPGDAAFESILVDQLDLNDQSGNSNNASNAGATWQTSVKKFYGGAVDFDGSKSVLTVPYSSDFDPGTGDYSVELWAYWDPNQLGTLMSWHGGSVGARWDLGCLTAGALRFFINNGTSYTVSTTVSTATWLHIAAQRRGNTMELFVNGSPVGTTTISGIWPAGSTSGLLIGCRNPSTGNVQHMNGHIQDVRIYKGIAKYSSSFTPPERSVQGTARRYPSGVYVVS